MNQKQKEYALKRVKQIAKDKIEKKTKHLKYKIGCYGINSLPAEEMFKLIKEGTVKLRKSFKKDNYGQITIDCFFDFRKHSKKYKDDQQKEIDREKAEYQEIFKKIKNQSIEIQDLIMLGDAEEALNLIEEFECE